MANINIEIPDELHKKLKLHSIRNDKCLKDDIIDILGRSMH